MKLAISAVPCLVLVFTLLLGAPATSAAPGVTERVSVDSNGTEANSVSELAAISADGRFVAFASLASNLVPDDTNDTSDVFVHDRLTGNTERVSVDGRGRQGDGASGFLGVGGQPAISADGRFVAFPSFATNLVPGDTNGPVIADVFVRDRLTGTTERISVSSTGAEADSDCNSPAISADGRFVAFQSRASTFAPNDGFFTSDIFVRDRLNGTTERVTVSSSGQGADGDSFFPDISTDGRFVVFSSFADNLGPGENTFLQILIHDRSTGTTERVSEDASGTEGDGDSNLPVVSGDGRFVAFETNAANLIGDGSHQLHVLVHDRQTGTTERASVDNAGNAGDELSGEPDITPDGRFVTFFSLATNLVPGDTNNRRDIFVRDRQSGTTERVSVSTAGAEGNSESVRPKTSDDGLQNAFQSNADNLVPEDTGPSTDIFVNDRRPPADLTLTKADAPDPVQARMPLTYTVTVFNNGPSSATGVTLIDHLPADAVFVSATPGQGSCTRSGKGRRDGVLTCDLGALASGATTSVTIVVGPARAGLLSNTATVRASEPDPNRADNSATETTTVF
jgi:uncharacterized repeat protein (TIGR01451 family)